MAISKQNAVTTLVAAVVLASPVRAGLDLSLEDGSLRIDDNPGVFDDGERNDIKIELGAFGGVRIREMAVGFNAPTGTQPIVIEDGLVEYAPGAITQIFLDAREEDDRITICPTDPAVTFLSADGGQDDDDITIVDTVAGLTSVNGSFGRDTLTVIDAHASVLVDGSFDDDTIVIENIHAGGTVRGNEGRDSITVNDANGDLLRIDPDSFEDTPSPDDIDILGAGNDGGLERLEIFGNPDNDPTSNAVVLRGPINVSEENGLQFRDIGTVDLLAGAVLNASGEIDAPVMLADGTRIAPGPGTRVLLTRSILTQGSGERVIDIDVSTAGRTSHDLLGVTGTVDLSGATLLLTVTGGKPVDDPVEIPIIDNDGVDPVFSTFMGLPEGTLIPGGLGGAPVRLTYVGGDGNDVTLVQVATGACCFADGSCSDEILETCAASGGLYQGNASACGPDACAAASTPDRVNASEKGSLLVFPKVELRWSGADLLQDTFLSITNDYPKDVDVQMHFVNGAFPWNSLDNRITLTANEPAYWSALTGDPKGFSPFTALGAALPAGDGTGDTVLRGFVIAWAVGQDGEEIRWNHLSGAATIVSYGHELAWEYNAYAVPAIDDAVAHGGATGSPGELRLDGEEFAPAFSQLLLNFQATGSDGFSAPPAAGFMTTSDTDLTLHPVSADLRQNTSGPVTTKASIEIWNENETKFSGTHRCITCWDQTLISRYDAPNSFLQPFLQTDHGKARIDGHASPLCDIPEIDVVSEDAALLGVAARLIVINGAPPAWDAAAGSNLPGMGLEAATIRFDPQDAGGPPEAKTPQFRR